jgi:hypothetical protein
MDAKLGLLLQYSKYIKLARLAEGKDLDNPIK